MMALIIRDTRDKPGKHENVDRKLEALGHKIIRSKLYVGDVARADNITVSIDLKQDLQEVYSNIVGAQHDRFRRECLAAHEAGIRLIILVEHPGICTLEDVARWENPRIKRWQKIRNGKIAGGYRNMSIAKNPPVSSEQLMKAMRTISERYGCEWMFCEKWRTAYVICDLLGIGG